MSAFDFTDSEYDSEYDSEIIYEPEEHCLTRFTISLCELYNEKIHGKVDSDVLYHYLVYERYKKLDVNYIKYNTDFLQQNYSYLPNKNHDIFRNYKEIIYNENYMKPEITECIYLNTGHCIAIKKTFWLRLIQRTWKNILKKRKEIHLKISNPLSLRNREITSKYSYEYLNYPRLKGMLYYLKS
jgi:hypothetical protein